MLLNFETMVNETYNYIEQDIKGETLILPKSIIECTITKLYWKNVKNYLKVIKRHPDHFMNFLKKEFTNREVNWVSSSKSDGLIIHGKGLKPNNITEISLKYVNMYVKCSSCKKTNTFMIKSDFECLDCGMKKYIN